jgi:signal transduction histidine kinase
MQSKTHRAPFTLLLVGALIALLVLLAFLQYRWLGQISIAERQTMQTNLRSQGRALQEEITKQLDLPASRLRMSVSDYRGEKWGELTGRYVRWKDSATYPGLIRTVFLARSTAEGQFDLMQFDESAGRLEPAAWPDSLSGIRERFAPRRRSYAYATEPRERERQEERSLGSLVEHGYVAEDIPALVRFPIEFERTEEPKTSAERGQLRVETVETLNQSPLVIVVLDIEYIKHVFLPELFKRRFTSDGTLDYDMALVYQRAVEERNERAGRGPADASPGDLAVNLFLSASSAELNRGRRWQIVINHRAGSLDAAVARARTRNLLVSFSILGLLAVSMMMIIVFSRRAQRLARKQIDFVAGISHEFRTPLAVIHAVSENLADGLITDRQQVEQCGVVIRNDVRRLAGMVEQMLEFAGASRGKTLYHPQPVDVTDLIDRALAGNPVLEARQDWQIDKDIEPNLPPVLADRTALASAVQNIIDNAVKYRGSDHWIGITAKTHSTSHIPKVEITIADKGIGIPEADLPHIFEAFYRGQTVVNAQIHGNGLGLSLVKNIVDAHGGTIAVASTPGEGSSFTLSLPAANGTAGSSSPR